MILIGDCLALLPTLAADSVDSVVTDPPYGLKFMGKAWDHGTPGKEFWVEALRVAKPGAFLVAFGGTRTFHRLACAIEDAGWELRDTVLRMHEGGREAVVPLEDCPWLLAWAFGSGFPKSHNLAGDREGWGTALKPAFEPIILARKPFKATVAANVEKHGTGALNIDACRIETGEINPSIARRQGSTNHLSKRSAAESEAAGKLESRQSPEAYSRPRPSDELGRWPANVLHDGSEEVLAAFPDAPGQMANAKTDGENKTRNIYGAMRYGRAGEPSADSDNEGTVGFKMKPGERSLDSGSAARFFYCAKASREDRNDGCSGLPLKPSGMVSNTSGQHLTRRDGGAPPPAENSHPTVKPTELMRWLCRLVTPPGGTILDPFMGSGSTGRAASAEGFQFIGIELDPDYAAIAEARIKAVQPGLGF